MSQKPWRTLRLMVNGIGYKVQFNQDSIDYLFVPFLKKLSRLARQADRRILVFLAAPPAVGKSTLALFLEKLADSHDDLLPVQSLGLDGFHYPNSYLVQHSVERDGEFIRLDKIKGAPETFDIEALTEKLEMIKVGNIRWPIYDRRIHDPVPDVLSVKKPIVLIEGNYLLLREPGWQELNALADTTLFINAPEEYLMYRLIQRKIKGGLTELAARNFYETSDRKNIERIMKNSWAADETWKMLEDGDYVRDNMAKKPVKRVNREALWKKTDVVEKDAVMEGLGVRFDTSKSQLSSPTLYEAGYTEGLSEARNNILRRIVEQGNMSRGDIERTFDVGSSELDNIMNLLK